MGQMSGYSFEKHNHYSTIRFTSELSEMAWEDVDRSTKKVTELVLESKIHSVMVDLSELATLPSGVVASLVKTWKDMDERKRRFFVVAPHQSVIQEIENAGLAKLWTVTPDLQTAYKSIGVTGKTDIKTDRMPNPAGVNAAIPASNAPFDFIEQHAFVSVALNPRLAEMDWQAMESATGELIQKVEASERPSVMVDLSRMEYINSGLVASLVRVWKSTQQKRGQFSLVSPNRFVTDVLKSSGLWNLWTVVDSREEAVYELGVSTAAKMETRERRVLVLVSLPCALLAVCATVLMLFKRNDIMGVNAQLTALLLGAAALATGAISIMKDAGIRRKLSGLSVVLALLVLSTLWFKENPIAFGQIAPERNLDREFGDTPPTTNVEETLTAASSDDETETTPSATPGETPSDDDTSSPPNIELQASPTVSGPPGS